MYIPDTEEFDALAYGVQHPSTLQYAQERLYQASQTVTDAGRQFVEAAKARFEQFSGAAAIRRAKAIVRAGAHVFDADNIRELNTLGKLQNARPVMQNYIMAQPTIQKAYYNQTIEAYEGYVDVFPGLLKEYNPLYQQVMDGMVMEDDQGNWRYDTWVTAPEDLQPLEMADQIDISRTWEWVEAIYKRGQENPLSKWGGML